MQSAFASAEGQAAGAHAQSLAEMDILLFDNQEA
jgi:hypothetical protein